MYDFLKQAAGLNSKLEEDEIQIEANDPWWEEEDEECECCEVEEDEELDYSWVWEVPFTELYMEMDDDTADNWDDLRPNDLVTVTDYLLELEDLLGIEFQEEFWATSFRYLFLDLEQYGDGSVNITIDIDKLIDYLKEEC